MAEAVRSDTPDAFAATAKESPSLFLWDVGPLQHELSNSESKAEWENGEDNGSVPLLKNVFSLKHVRSGRMSVSLGFDDLRPLAVDDGNDQETSFQPPAEGLQDADELSSVDGADRSVSASTDEFGMSGSAGAPVRESLHADNNNRLSSFYYQVMHSYREAVAAGNVVLEDSPYEIHNIPKTLQGDAGMYAAENLQKRLALQHDAATVSFLEATWALLPKRGEVRRSPSTGHLAAPTSPAAGRRASQQATSTTPLTTSLGSPRDTRSRSVSPPPQTTSPLDSSQELFINFNIFRAVSAYLFRRLVPDGKAEDFLEYCEADWRLYASPGSPGSAPLDGVSSGPPIGTSRSVTPTTSSDTRRALVSPGNSMLAPSRPHTWLMSKQQFMKAMFSVVDVWTTTAEANEYHHFFERVVLPQARKIASIDPNAFFDVKKNVFAKGAFRKKRRQTIRATGKAKSSPAPTSARASSSTGAGIAPQEKSNATPVTFALAPELASAAPPLAVKTLDDDGLQLADNIRGDVDLMPYLNTKENNKKSHHDEVGRSSTGRKRAVKRVVNAEKLLQRVEPQRLNVFCIESDSKMQHGPVLAPSAHNVRNRLQSMLVPPARKVQELLDAKKSNKLTTVTFKLFALGTNDQILEFQESEFTTASALPIVVGADGKKPPKRPLPLVDVRVAAQSVSSLGCNLYTDADKKARKKKGVDPHRVGSSVKPWEGGGDGTVRELDTAIPLVGRRSSTPQELDDDDEPQQVLIPEEVVLSLRMPPSQSKEPKRVSGVAAPRQLTSLCIVDDNLLPNSVCDAVTLPTFTVEGGARTLLAPYSRLEEALDLLEQESRRLFTDAIDDCFEDVDDDGNVIDKGHTVPSSPVRGASVAPEEVPTIPSASQRASPQNDFQRSKVDDDDNEQLDTAATQLDAPPANVPTVDVKETELISSVPTGLPMRQQSIVKSRSMDFAHPLHPTDTVFTHHAVKGRKFQATPKPPSNVKPDRVGSGAPRVVYHHSTRGPAAPLFPVEPSASPYVEKRKNFRQECGEVVSESLLHKALDYRRAKERLPPTVLPGHHLPRREELQGAASARTESKSSADTPESLVASGHRDAKNKRLGEPSSARGALPTDSLRQVKAVVPRIVPTTKVGKIVVVERDLRQQPAVPAGRGSIPCAPRGHGKHHVNLKIYEHYDRAIVDHLLAGPSCGIDPPSKIRAEARATHPKPGEQLESIICAEPQRYPRSVTALAVAAVTVPPNDPSLSALPSSFAALMKDLPVSEEEASARIASAVVSGSVDAPRLLQYSLLVAAKRKHDDVSLAACEASKESPIACSRHLENATTVLALPPIPGAAEHNHFVVSSERHPSSGGSRTPLPGALYVPSGALVLPPLGTAQLGAPIRGPHLVGEFDAQLQKSIPFGFEHGHLSASPGRRAVVEHMERALVACGATRKGDDVAIWSSAVPTTDSVLAAVGHLHHLQSSWSTGIVSQPPKSVLDRPEEYFALRSMAALPGRDVNPIDVLKRSEQELLCADQSSNQTRQAVELNMYQREQQRLESLVDVSSEQRHIGILRCISTEAQATGKPSRLGEKAWQKLK